MLGLGARHRGIVELSEGVIRCVTVFACYSSSSWWLESNRLVNSIIVSGWGIPRGRGGEEDSSVLLIEIAAPPYADVGSTPLTPQNVSRTAACQLSHDSCLATMLL